MIRIVLAAVLLLSLCSCGLIKEWAKDAAAEEVTAQLDTKLKKEAPDTHAAMDADQSGKVTLEEWQAYGIPAGVIALLLEMLRRRMKQKVGSLHARIDTITQGASAGMTAGVALAPAAAPPGAPPAKAA